MKTIRRFQHLLLLSTLVLWNCSGAAPVTPDDAAKPDTVPATPPPVVQAVPEPPAPVVKPAKPEVAVRRPKAPSATTVPPSAPPVAAAPPAVTPPAPVPAPPQVSTSAAVPLPPPPPAPTTKQVTIPAGTDVYVRMIDSVSSEDSHPGETFRASIDRPVVVNSQTVIPKNADVFVKLVEAQSAGKLKGTSELKLQLDRVVVNKKTYDVASNTYAQTGDSAGKKAVRNVGVGAAVGGILGGILGGKKGAVIGAGAGGGGGAVVSNGEQVRVESETQLVFRLEDPLEVTISLKPEPVTPRRLDPGDSSYDRENGTSGNSTGRPRTGRGARRP